MLLRTLYYFYILKRNLSQKLLRIQETQRKKFRSIINYAYENVPFYHRRFDKARFKPNGIKSVDDLQKIPVVTRSEIQSSPLPLMKMLEGSQEDFPTALDGKTSSPAIIANLEEIKQYRVVQERIDKLTILLVGLRSPPNKKIEENAMHEVERHLGKGVQVEFQLVEKIERDAGGKLRKIISNVPTKWRT